MATLWLDRPEKRNALGPAFWDDLPVAMAAIGADPGIRAVVVAARGPHFTVGLDLVAMSGISGRTAPVDGSRPSAVARARPPARRSSACRPRSPRWPTAPCR